MNVATTVKRMIPASAKATVRDVRGRVRGARNRGSAVHCNVCGGDFARFLPFKGRPDVQCPRCESLERHRAAIATWDELGVFTDNLRVLHVAPEWMMERALRKNTGLTYITGDLYAGKADMVLDLTAIDAPDHSFDVILCSHVLEHIPDDMTALGEIRRVLAPSGMAFLVVPVDPTATAIYEDPTVVDPADREREFGQADHVRWYNRDGFRDRVRAAGFDIESVTGDHSNGEWVPGDEAVIARPAA